MLTSIKIKEYNIYQDTELQSITLDSILISDFVKINRRSKNILDIGTGNAIIPILISKRTSANITGVEILEKSYNIALKNVEENNISININDYNNLIDMLGSLGFYSYTTVTKSRSVYTKTENNIEYNIMIDTVRSIPDITNIFNYFYIANIQKDFRTYK